MKIKILLATLLLIPLNTYATPVSWDGNFSTQILQPLQSFWGSTVKATKFTATSTTQASIFPYASTTVLSATSLCLTGDLPCKTAWPTGGSSIGWATSTDAGNLESIYFTGLSNVGIGTTSPYAPLSVVGEIVAQKFNATSSNATSTLRRTGFAPNNNPIVENGLASPYAMMGTIVKSNSTIEDLYFYNSSQSGNQIAGVIGFGFQQNRRAEIYAQIVGAPRTNLVFRVTNSSGTMYDAMTIQNTGQVALVADTGVNSTPILIAQNNNNSSDVIDAFSIRTASGGLAGSIGLNISPITNTGGNCNSDAGRRCFGIYSHRFSNTNSDFRVGANFYTFEGSTASGGAATIPGTYSSKMTLNSNGAFGIGSTTPYAWLSVTGRVYATSSLTYAPIFVVASSTGQHALTVAYDSNVGLGTTSPYAKLSVVGAVVAEYFHATSTTATSTFAGDVTLQRPTKLAQYTVATLPACSAGYQGAVAYVTDALAPAFLTPIVGGGAVVTPVFCDGTNWVAD